MHDKFAILDSRLLVTGSYNWTRAADERNLENVVFLDEAGSAQDYAAAFKRLWGRSRAPTRAELLAPIPETGG